MNVIPAIDIRNGRCVRLLQGEFDRETHYNDDPAAVARQYVEMGFSMLHLVDLDGARDAEQQNRDLVRRIVLETPLDVQLGGGIRDRSTLASWFDDGIQRAVIGSIAVTDVERVRRWLSEFGANRIVLALDCRRRDDGTPMLATHGWTRASTVSLWQCIDNYIDAGLQHVLCTDVARDGAMTGPSLPLYREFRKRYPSLALQASGGVRDTADLDHLRQLGAAGAITGRALLDGCISASEVAAFLHGA